MVHIIICEILFNIITFIYLFIYLFFFKENWDEWTGNGATGDEATGENEDEEQQCKFKSPQCNHNLCELFVNIAKKSKKRSVILVPTVESASVRFY